MTSWENLCGRSYFNKQYRTVLLQNCGKFRPHHLEKTCKDSQNGLLLRTYHYKKLYKWKRKQF